MSPDPRILAALPHPSALRRLCIAQAVLDEILMPDWEDRWSSFDGAWGPGLLMASMRDGSGDEVFIGFCAAGVFIKGFAHEGRAAVDDVFAGLPAGLHGFRDEPAFSPADTTFCIWWDRSRPGWQTAPGSHDSHDGDAGEVPDADGVPDDADGSATLLAILDGRPETWQAHAAALFEVDVPLASIRHVYEHRPLDEDFVRGLNADAGDDVLENAAAAGYGAGWNDIDTW